MFSSRLSLFHKGQVGSMDPCEGNGNEYLKSDESSQRKTGFYLSPVNPVAIDWGHKDWIGQRISWDNKPEKFPALSTASYILCGCRSCARESSCWCYLWITNRWWNGWNVKFKNGESGYPSDWFDWKCVGLSGPLCPTSSLVYESNCK